MRSEAPGLRTRVRQALDAPVEEAEKLLSELSSAETETKLSVLVSGWGRGLAAALEELAIAIDELRGKAAEPKPDVPSGQRAVDEAKPGGRIEQADRTDTAELGEAGLVDEARKSREATAELREEAEQVRGELER